MEKEVVKVEDVKTEATKTEEGKPEEIIAEVSTIEEVPVNEEKPAKKPAKKAATTKKKTKKAEEKITEVMLQFQGRETVISGLEEKIKAQFVEDGHRAGNIKDLKIYVKPEEEAAYYVINENYTGRVDLF